VNEIIVNVFELVVNELLLLLVNEILADEILVNEIMHILEA
jgi:hypothetical protein